MKGFRERLGMDCERTGDEGLRADMMDVLYGEADSAARTRVGEHLEGCAACRGEMAALRGVRRDLRAWRVPATRPSFSPRGVYLPRWAAAAALLLIGFGATLGATGYDSLRRSLAAQEARAADLERKHQQEMRALQASIARVPGASFDPATLLAGIDARIDERLRESESRQAGRVDSRLAGWQKQVDAQRRVDMARVAASLSYLDGRHGQQLARTNELMGYVLETSARKR